MNNKWIEIIEDRSGTTYFMDLGFFGLIKQDAWCEENQGHVIGTSITKINSTELGVLKDLISESKEK